ncbi:MAG: replication initiation factor [Inoviridae sp.]|nr:MAG: replication initiation factor [Inoviridae sp.]
MLLKFDAFAFRVELDISIVCQLFENIGFSLPAGSPRYGYRYCYDLELGGLNHGLIQYGGDSVGTGVYVSVMGSHSGRVRDAVLSAGWSGHLIRADIALDFNGSKYFKKLSSDLVELAKNKNLKTSTVGDWVQGVGGRTLYVGSRTSAQMIGANKNGLIFKLSHLINRIMSFINQVRFIRINLKYLEN